MESSQTELASKRGLILADTHWASSEPFNPVYLMVKQFAQDFKPDFVVHLGDALDLAYFSIFDANNIKVQAKGSWEADVNLFNQELDSWQKICPIFYLVQGNHDERAERQALEYPKFAESLDYPTRLHLKDRKIPFHRLVDKPLKLGKLHFIHGWYYNKYHSRTTIDAFSGNIVYGHVHAFQTTSKLLTAQSEEIQAWSIAGLCDKQPDYVKGRPTGWQHGFAVVYISDRGNFNLYPVNIVSKSFRFEGKEYR